MRSYLDLIRRVWAEGELRSDRTGFGTRSLFGTTLRHDLASGFPALTTKKLAFRQVAAELCCFLRAYDTLEQFHSVGCTIWDANGTDPRWVERAQAYAVDRGEGYLGPIYGVAWRRWSTHMRPKLGSLDQLRLAVEVLRSDPWSRRAVVSAWNPIHVDHMCLPPCHTMFQFSVRQRETSERRLDCAVTMRSVDTFLGMPFDIASYALLTHIVAGELSLDPGVLTFNFGDTHVYLNHEQQVAKQLEREPRALPQLVFETGRGWPSIDDFHPDMVRLVDYDPHPAISAEMNV